jgi:hypothetical protein
LLPEDLIDARLPATAFPSGSSRNVWLTFLSGVDGLLRLAVWWIKLGIQPERIVAGLALGTSLADGASR